MPQRLFANAVASSTCASAINNSQTTITLQSTSGFLVPSASQQFSATILDTGNPAYNANSPLATPYEYVFCTGNNQGTNTLTVQRGVGGTSGRAFFAGATVSQTFLAEDMNASFPIKIVQVVVGTDVSAPAASIRLPLGSGSLPQNFTHLLLLAIARGDTAGSGGDPYRTDLSMQFNGDAANNYMFEYLDVVTAVSGNQIGGQSSISIGHVATASATVGTPGSSRIDIPSYSGTTWIKQAVSQSVRLDTGGSGHLRWGSWNSTAAITFITLRSAIGSFVAGSRFDLYGIP